MNAVVEAIFLREKRTGVGVADTGLPCVIQHALIEMMKVTARTKCLVTRAAQDHHGKMCVSGPLNQLVIQELVHLAGKPV